MNTLMMQRQYLPPAGGYPLPAAPFAAQRDSGLLPLLDQLGRVDDQLREVWTLAAAATEPASSAYVVAEMGAGGECVASYIARERHRKGQAVIGVDEKRCSEWTTADGVLQPEIERRLRCATLYISDIDSVPVRLQQQFAEKIGGPWAPRFVVCERYLQNGSRTNAPRESILRTALEASLIRVPALRDYIPHLPYAVRFFAAQFSRRFGKPVTRIHPDSLDCLRSHWWPGNLFELRNVIERAVLLATGEEFQLAADLFVPAPAAPAPAGPSGDAIQPSGGFPTARLRRTLDYVEQHLGDEIELQHLAVQAGMSRFHFCRQFKRSMGLTPHQYVLRQRVERAKSILKSQPSSLAGLSHDLGFTSQSHFTTVFRKFVGTTPKAYREMS